MSYVPFRDASYAILGIVVNPKLHKCALAVWAGYSEVIITNLTLWSTIGEGYFDRHMNEAASQISGCPRAHTPSGVSDPGLGYGTCLYTALTVAAFAANNSMLPINTGYYKADCIASMERTRSLDAERWWTRAKSHGLTYQVEGTADRIEYIEHEIDGDRVVKCVPELEDLGAYPGRKIVSVVGCNVLRSVPLVADVYAYQSAQENNLVALYRPIPLRELNNTLLESVAMEYEKHWDYYASYSDPYVNVGLLLSADVRGISEGALNLILAACRYGGASEKELEGVRFRWEHDLDPKMPAEQMEQALRPNGVDRRKAREILETTAYLRSETGWDELADLP
jgi:hypothetical protein